MAYESNDCLPIVKMRSIGDHGFDRNVVREDLAVRVENRAALCMNDLLVNVFFSSKPGVFVVLYCLQINQAK